MLNGFATGEIETFQLKFRPSSEAFWRQRLGYQSNGRALYRPVQKTGHHYDWLGGGNDRRFRHREQDGWSCGLVTCAPGAVDLPDEHITLVDHLSQHGSNGAIGPPDFNGSA
jgi:hypothetical protein